MWTRRVSVFLILWAVCHVSTSSSLSDVFTTSLSKVANLTTNLENSVEATTSTITEGWSNATSIFQNLAKYLENELTSQNTSERIAQYGYRAEVHSVTTKDGYVLEMVRIIKSSNSTKPPILVIPGLLNSADDWLVHGNTSLPFLLSDAGYDVWLGNNRGNTYSRKHKTLSTSNPAFWNFTWHEMGIYDLPALIDYTLNTTDASNLTYIGHSQGTTQFFVLLSELPEYNAKINVGLCLAPIAYISNATCPLVQVAAKIWPEIQVAIKTLNLQDFLPHLAPYTTLTALCASSPLLSFVCVTLLYSFYGFDYGQYDHNLIGTQLKSLPGGCSAYQPLHYLQLCDSREFRNYDYGTAGNMARYNSTTPTSYNLGRISAKIALFSSQNDWLSDIKDVNILSNALGNVVVNYEVTDPHFNHQDYLWAKNVSRLVYPRMLEIVSTYS